MLTEPQYRTFDELLDSVKLDLKSFDLEGMIDAQQLIKVAMRVNYELGLRINQSRAKAITVYKGKAKLPVDFYVLNFALICEDTTAYKSEIEDKTYTEGVTEGVLQGIYLAQQYYLNHTVGSYTTTLSIPNGVTTITHNLNTHNVIVEAFAPDGTMLTFEVHSPTANTITITSNAPTTQLDIKVVIIGAPETPATTVTQLQEATCPAELINDPFMHIPKVIYVTNGKLMQAKRLAAMRIEKSKDVSADCVNLQSTDYRTAHIKNGFLVTNFDEGTVYINYQSLMEDDNGNLMVLDHPLCNEFYEYAIKQRIFENLMFAGENVTNHIQFVEQRLRAARNNAYSFVNTPDFNELKKNWEMNRKAMYHRYYNMFKSSIV